MHELKFWYDLSYNRAEKNVSLPVILNNARVDTYLTADKCVLFVGEVRQPAVLL